jgi:hypothetical protein
MISTMMLRAVLVVLALAFAQSAAAQDKPVSVVDTDPMPVSIEAGTFFLFGGQVTLSVRNRHTAPVIVTLRAWVFDQRGRLKGTTSYCVAEWIDRGTRRVLSFTLDVAGLVSTDDVTVGVEQVVSERQSWGVADGPDVAVAQAQRGGLGGRGRLRLEEWRTDAASTPCPCECRAVAAACESQCAELGLKAFSCSPIVLDGCSASCSCK